MSIPLPPGARKPEVGTVMPASAPGPSDDKVVSTDAVNFILQTTLLPEHREDPNIIRWISSYLVCRDAKQAAKEAGLTPKSGENLKRRPDIHAAISAITAQAVVKHGYDAAEVVEKVKEIAFLDPIEFENEDGTFKEHLRDISPEARRAIKKFKAKNIIEKDPNGMDVVVG
ncbi:MAG: terminase small subunit, partial [Bdellovibrio sp.]